ncbi:flagellar biosynthesis anti-sigma factor FlgM [Ideonella dechloratans]|uniref:Negative regulator of flagellin synthesis n=1 Tax=Ideonella dechloratans TaxID=36863 RepID=A0A643FBZ9_IDEDE|nr:flagellar biosynthesis anti-sigma factor FlgM [Ideonella dechloratans]KAB0581089.1 flagellar biosynthesis anti-sigma factor FlgM [Ideonella dechloratans]UFU09209.1 flagellar biosynthesis anti-sigma factor FlgM [Ideonella dechloratans]
MKIGSPEHQVAVSTLTNDRSATGSAKKASTTSQSNSSDSATVALSSAASQLRDSGALDGTFDAEKVARIAQAIKDGKFQVNADKIADKMIANAQELLNNSRSS